MLYSMWFPKSQIACTHYYSFVPDIAADASTLWLIVARKKCRLEATVIRNQTVIPGSRGAQEFSTGNRTIVP